MLTKVYSVTVVTLGPYSPTPTVLSTICPTVELAHQWADGRIRNEKHIEGAKCFKSIIGVVLNTDDMEDCRATYRVTLERKMTETICVDIEGAPSALEACNMAIVNNNRAEYAHEWADVSELTACSYTADPTEAEIVLEEYVC